MEGLALDDNAQEFGAEFMLSTVVLVAMASLVDTPEPPLIPSCGSA